MEARTAVGCVVGYGHIAETFASNIANSVRSTLKYASGRNPSRIEAFAKKFHCEAVVLSDFETKVLADKDVDFVVVCTPTYTHFDLVSAALKAGKHVFCEKPLTVGADRVRELGDLANAANLVLMAGFQRRMDEDFCALKDTVSSDEVGDVEIIRITSRDGYGETKETELVVYEALIHDFDMCHFLTGQEPDIVQAFQPTRESLVVFLKYSSGILVTINWAKDVSYLYDQRVEVFGSKGTAMLNNVPQAHVIKCKNREEQHLPYHDYYTRRYVNAYRAELNHFLDAMKGVCTNSLLGIEQSICSAKIADRVLASLASSARDATVVPTVQPCDLQYPYTALADSSHHTAQLQSRKKLRMCLVGANGRMGHIRFECFVRHPRIEVAAVVDSTGKVHETMSDIPFFSDVDAALSAVEVDACWICVPTPYHLGTITKIAAHGKPMFTEKPVAVSVPDIDKCFDIAKAAGVPLLCGWQWRFDNHFKELKRYVENGMLGLPRQIETTFGDNPPPPPELMGHLGSMVHDMMVHQIDACLWLVGALPERVYGMMASNLPYLREAGMFDTAIVALFFPGGISATLNGRRRNGAGGYDIRMELLGATGNMAKVDNPLGPAQHWSGDGILVQGNPYSFPDRFADAYYNEVDHFVCVLLDGAAPLMSHASCRAVTAVADAVVQSLSTGAVVDVKW